MSTVILYPDIPCCYPVVIGDNSTASVGNTSKLLAVFRNESDVSNLRAILARFQFHVNNPSADTTVVIQMVGGVTASNGTWNSITGSELEINTTATTITGGKVAYTEFTNVTTAHGNTPASGSISSIDAESLGLALHRGEQFAIYAKTLTTGATVTLHWTFNWTEKD